MSGVRVAKGNTPASAFGYCAGFQVQCVPCTLHSSYSFLASGRYFKIQVAKTVHAKQKQVPFLGNPCVCNWLVDSKKYLQLVTF